MSPLPKSLQNIFRELADDFGHIAPSTGDLSAWVDQGVMLLNRTLSVSVGAAGSHAKIGWHAITDTVVSAIAARPQPLVSILWGSHAQQLLPLVSARPVVTSAHPSPLSAYRGFFGSKPFSRTNDLLVGQGSTPIDWQL
jgi:uracil-DNA glycosylase